MLEILISEILVKMNSTPQLDYMPACVFMWTFKIHISLLWKCCNGVYILCISMPQSQLTKKMYVFIVALFIYWWNQRWFNIIAKKEIKYLNCDFAIVNLGYK